MFFLKDSIFEEPRPINEQEMPPKSTDDSSVNSFWLPSRNPALKIMALFSSAYHFAPRFADAITVQAETTKSFAISLTYIFDFFF